MGWREWGSKSACGRFLSPFQGWAFCVNLPMACAPSTSSGQALGCILSPLCGWVQWSSMPPNHH
jgi:hypothetical protein